MCDRFGIAGAASQPIAGCTPARYTGDGGPGSCVQQVAGEPPLGYWLLPYRDRIIHNPINTLGQNKVLITSCKLSCQRQ